MLKIISTVIVCQLDRSLDLSFLLKNLEGAFPPKRGLSRINFRLKPDNYHFAFYRSGKVLITGVKSLDKIETAGHYLISLLKKANINVEISSIEIANIVCSNSLNYSISLENLICHLNSNNASYEPEQFPGLIYKKYGGTFLIFSNGKVILTGFRDFKTAKTSFEKFKKVIES